MGKLDGNFVLITGGSKEIGFATGQEFVDEGAFKKLSMRQLKNLVRKASLESKLIHRN